MTNQSTITTVFDLETVIDYLYSLKSDISPLKLQKSLYFLFGYYGAIYGQSEDEGTFEGSSDYENRLFNANFEAWQYGPVIRNVYSNNKAGNYPTSNQKSAIEKVVQKNEIRMFIDELFEQINSVSDFTLVDRSHQDDVWKEAYKKGQSTPMDHEAIIAEYVEKYA
ncbi:Panacea domain-containing protein [Paenibacillus kyungheensis]